MMTRENGIRQLIEHREFSSLACAVQGAKPPSSVSAEGASREGNTAPVIVFPPTVRHGLTTPAVEGGSKTLATRPTLFRRGSKRRSRFVIAGNL